MVESINSNNDDASSAGGPHINSLNNDEGCFGSYHKKYTKTKARDCTPKLSPPEANYHNHLMSTAKKNNNAYLTFGADKTPSFKQLMDSSRDQQNHHM